MNDPVWAEALAGYYRYCQTKRPLDYALLFRERERAEAINDHNTQRIIQELIDHDTAYWRAA